MEMTEQQKKERDERIERSHQYRLERLRLRDQQEYFKTHAECPTCKTKRRSAKGET